MVCFQDVDAMDKSDGRSRCGRVGDNKKCYRLVDLTPYDLPPVYPPPRTRFQPSTCLRKASIHEPDNKVHHVKSDDSAACLGWTVTLQGIEIGRQRFDTGVAESLIKVLGTSIVARSGQGVRQRPHVEIDSRQQY